MKHLNILFIFLFVFSSIAISQYINVPVDNVASHQPEEVTICINPKNLNQLVAGANITNCYYSTNGGLNWVWQDMTSPYGVWGDPIVAVDTMGYFYYFHLSNATAWIDRMVVQKSTNGGINWSTGYYFGLNAPKKEDKEGVVVNRTNNYIYVTWTEFDSYISNPPQTDSSRILFAVSTNGGVNWTTPAIRIDKLGGDCIDSDNTVEGAVPAVGPNGQIYVAWAGPKIRNSQFGIFFNKSTNNGQTWLAEPIYIADQKGGWDYNIAGIQRCNGLPATCCDVSNGPYRGNIYVNWTDSTGNLDHDVKMIKSTNGGVNWSAVKRVNNDAAGKEQFFTWMTIDQATGYLYFVFYDRRNYTNNNTDVYMARSTDGGETFNNFVVSSSPFLPTASAFFGDYNGITAHAGKIRPIWTRLVSNQLSIWTAIVDFTSGINDPGNNIPVEYSLKQNYPNPFNPSTVIYYDIKENTFVTLKVFDLLGKEVATLVSGYKPAGSYDVTFFASEYNLSSGVYFYKLTAGNFTDVKKMTLIK